MHPDVNETLIDYIIHNVLLKNMLHIKYIG